MVAAMTFGVSGIAAANGRDRCTDAALDGFYVFTASGFDIVSGVSQPIAIVESRCGGTLSALGSSWQNLEQFGGRGQLY